LQRPTRLSIFSGTAGGAARAFSVCLSSEDGVAELAFEHPKELPPMVDRRRPMDGRPHNDLILVCRRDTFPKATVLRLEGEIDLNTAPILEDSLTTALQRGEHVIVDMKDVRYIDASLYQVLARVREWRRTPQQRLVLVELTPSIQETVRILGLQRVVDITTSVEAAKRWLEI
jgi:anti-anti-sigma factor